MTKKPRAADQIMEGLNEALAFAKGEAPIAGIHIRGHDYVPEVEYRRVRKALEAMTEHYVKLAGSGDCGLWNPEDEPEVKDARAVLAERPN